MTPQKRKVVINTFDDFEKECRSFPGAVDIQFNVSSPLEQHFFEVADKHGVLDEMLDPERYLDEP